MTPTSLECSYSPDYLAISSTFPHEKPHTHKLQLHWIIMLVSTDAPHTTYTNQCISSIPMVKSTNLNSWSWPALLCIYSKINLFNSARLNISLACTAPFLNITSQANLSLLQLRFHFHISLILTPRSLIVQFLHIIHEESLMEDFPQDFLKEGYDYSIYQIQQRLDLLTSIHKSFCNFGW